MRKICRLLIQVLTLPILLMLGMAKTQGDFIEAALGATETTETSIGTVTIPPTGVTRIVGIYGIAKAITTTAENVSGFFRLAFKTIPGVFRFPVTAFNAPAGTLAGLGMAVSPQIIPVDIAVPPNETVQGFMALDAVTTGTVRGTIGFIFE